MSMTRREGDRARLPPGAHHHHTGKHGPPCPHSVDLRQAVRHLPGADHGRSGHTHITVNTFEPLGCGQNHRYRRVTDHQVRHVRNSARDGPTPQQAVRSDSTRDSSRGMARALQRAGPSTSRSSTE
jgi:hypothetical protein